MLVIYPTQILFRQSLVNRLILEPWEIGSDRTAVVNGVRAKHLLEVCRLDVGDKVKLGVVNAEIGVGRILNIEGAKIRLDVELTDEVRLKSNVTFQIALPRPQMLRRILQKAATFGVRRLVLFRSDRVEKSYFSSPLLKEDSIRAELLVGLEQGGCTRLPEVVVYPRLRQFLESEQPTGGKFILEREASETFLEHRDSLSEPTFLIGPEGGFLPRELELFRDNGYQPIKLSENILRVESAFDFTMAQYSMFLLAGERA